VQPLSPPICCPAFRSLPFAYCALPRVVPPNFGIAVNKQDLRSWAGFGDSPPPQGGTPAPSTRVLRTPPYRRRGPQRIVFAKAGTRTWSQAGPAVPGATGRVLGKSPLGDCHP
jgi:hypothetical protein